MYLQELIVGKGVLEQYGCGAPGNESCAVSPRPALFLRVAWSEACPARTSARRRRFPYDEGAQLIEGGTGIPSLVGLAIATVITLGGSYAGLVAGNMAKKK